MRGSLSASRSTSLPVSSGEASSQIRISIGSGAFFSAFRIEDKDRSSQGKAL